MDNYSGYSGYSGYMGPAGSTGYSAETVIELNEPKAPEKKCYYGPNEEDAVVRFICSIDEKEKRLIYNNELRKPIDKMIESIIRTYKLYRNDFSFDDLHSDALSFLITKFDKFDPAKGKKSFSYFGTVTRNYLYVEMIKFYKKSTKTSDFDDVVGELINRPDMLTHIDTEEIDLSKFIQKLISEIEVELEDEKMLDNERKVGLSLVEILKNWHVLFENFVGTTKFNKNLILLYLREMTGLNTKEIRNSIKRYKSLYFLFKDKYIS